jgi:membrane fusion protein, heavy metal efflux system
MTNRLSYLIHGLILGALSLGVLLWPSPGFSHGEELEIAESTTRGPVTLTAAQTEALGLTLGEVDLRPIAKLLTLYGELGVLPDSEAAVTVRISGRIAAVYANVGDRVRKGQKLALLESRAVANPPPTVPVPAPMGGVIDWRNAVLGQPIEPSSTLFHISRLDSMRVILRIFEEDLDKIQVGLDAYVHLLAYPDHMFQGQVQFVAPTLDPDTRTGEAWVILDNGHGLLKPNLFAKADIAVGSNAAALSLPNAAILETQDEKFVFLKLGDQYARQDVTLGIKDHEFTEVTSELVPGDQVVVQGARQLYTLWLTGGGSGD